MEDLLFLCLVLKALEFSCDGHFMCSTGSWKLEFLQDFSLNGGMDKN